MLPQVQQDPYRDTLDDDVPVSSMFADPSYSRPVDQQFVRRLARDWDPAKAGVVYLSLRTDGRYAIIDGCHRVAACRLALGDTAVLPARVFIDLTPAQEAELWDAFNRYRRRPRQIDTFRARLIAGDKVATSIAGAVARAGLKLELTGRQHGASIVAITALESAYRRLGDHGLTVVLGILREAFDDDERGYQAPAIDGLSMIISRYGNSINRDRLIDTLRRLGPTRLLRLAHEYRAVHLGMPVAGAWARVVVMQYNRGLRSSALPDW
ncbi:MAG: hypothetical protein IRY83_04045 [Chloroflexi bacterium]|nr:hypothetical protein [Chloroflexota bacterium]